MIAENSVQIPKESRPLRDVFEDVTADHEIRCGAKGLTSIVLGFDTDGSEGGRPDVARVESKPTIGAEFADTTEKHSLAASDFENIPAAEIVVADQALRQAFSVSTKGRRVIE